MMKSLRIDEVEPWFSVHELENRSVAFLSVGALHSPSTV
eukprot:COSAG02_NODE_9_length_59728_cov_36.104714_69_plen_39_part_00